ncbi:MAG: aspartate/glutamate racemase [Rickettsiales bacterium]|jgi:aspartate/glutamate racemase
MTKKIGILGGLGPFPTIEVIDVVKKDREVLPLASQSNT